LNTIWTPLTRCLCFFNKNKDVKWCACFSSTTWDLFYDFCLYKNFRRKNVRFKGEREGIFSYCFIYTRNIQANSFTELHIFDINDWLTLGAWIMEPVGFARQVRRRSGSIARFSFQGLNIITIAVPPSACTCVGKSSKIRFVQCDRKSRIAISYQDN